MLIFLKDILLTWQDKARDTQDPLVLLRSSYNYLYLGSHLLDSNMWTFRARDGFNAVLSIKNFCVTSLLPTKGFT